MVTGDTAVRGRRASFEAKDARLVGCHPALGGDEASASTAPKKIKTEVSALKH